MSLPRIPQTRVIKKLGLSTVVAWDLSNCVSVEEGGAIDVSDRKVLPTHIKASGDVTLPDAKLHQGRAITIKGDGAAIDVFVDPTQPAVVSIGLDATEIVYSDGSSWVLF
jgi:hypothetical protein